MMVSLVIIHMKYMCTALV
jgi:hypothetical protein